MEKSEINSIYLKKTIEEKYKELKDTFRVLNDTKKITQNLYTLDSKLYFEKSFKEFEDIDFKIKFTCFILTSHLDLLAILKGLNNKNKTDWECIYYFRTAYLYIYETIQKYHNVYTKELKNIIDKEHEHFTEEYKKLNQELKRFKKEYDFTSIQNFRNETGGHYAKEYTDFYCRTDAIINEIKGKGVKVITFFSSFLDLVKFFNLLLTIDSERQIKEGVNKEKINEEKERFNECLKKLRLLYK